MIAIVTRTAISMMNPCMHDEPLYACGPCYRAHQLKNVVRKFSCS